MFYEYPKCLYQGGQVEAETRVVFDADEEKQASEEGFVCLGESQEKAKPKRKPKGE
jgi:hypothetical protein